MLKVAPSTDTYVSCRGSQSFFKVDTKYEREVQDLSKNTWVGRGGDNVFIICNYQHILTLDSWDSLLQIVKQIKLSIT